MIGYRFTKYNPVIENQKSSFENLLKVFLQLLTIASGDVNEALSWMNEIDRKYKLTDDQYGIGDFIDDLKKNNFIEQDETGLNLRPPQKLKELLESSHLRKFLES